MKMKMMKRNILLALFAVITVSLSAQKVERKAVREGNSAYKEQLYGKSEEQYLKALEVNAASKEASFNLANSYYRQKKWDDALKEYQHYLTLENENPEKMSSAWANMGNTFLGKKNAEGVQAPQAGGQPQAQQENNLEMSMEAYKNALRLNPADEDVRYNLAVVQKMIQDQQQDGGGGNDNQDQKDDKKDDQKDEQKQDKQDQNKDQKDDKKDDQKQDENQMSQDNIEQILKAIEQDEKETQERVKKAQAQERKAKNQHNKQHNKNW